MEKTKKFILLVSVAAGLAAFAAVRQGAADRPAGEAERLRKRLLVGLSEQHLHENFNSVEDCYSVALAKAGFSPVIIPCTTNEEVIASTVSRIDLLVLTGGADVNPGRYGAQASPKCAKPDLARDAFEFRLLAAARRRRLPVVGICRGCQLLNVAFGGTLWQDLPSEFTNRVAGLNHEFGSYYRPADYPSAHTVRPLKGTRLAAAIGEGDLAVNSHHHQAVKRLAAGFVVAARAPDGVIEAFEGTDYPAVGLQFHPEAIVARAEASDAYDYGRLMKLLRALPSLASD